MNDLSTYPVASEIGDLLLQRHLVLGTAESCTGGMIAAAITDVPGSSGWYEEGVVTYSNQAKQTRLQVSESDLVNHGAVSIEVVEAMARGVIQNGANVAVATSGVAGPGGGTDAKPVGLICFGWAIGDSVYSDQRHFSGDRQAVRAQATIHALSFLAELLKQRIPA